MTVGISNRQTVNYQTVNRESENFQPLHRELPNREPCQGFCVVSIIKLENESLSFIIVNSFDNGLLSYKPNLNLQSFQCQPDHSIIVTFCNAWGIYRVLVCID